MENEQTKISFEELENYIKANFELADNGIIRLLCGFIIANRFRGDPIWLMIISASSGLKTELIRALNKITQIYALSSLTSHTLISGQKNYAKTPSLLLRLEPNTILTFKDFTTILQMPDAVKNEILSQLREIYDGYYKKPFGTGDEIDWQGKIGFLAGVTEAIDLFQGAYSILGERFVQYRMKQPDRRKATEKGLENSSQMIDIREKMQDMFRDYIDSVSIPSEENMPKLSESLRGEILEISEFATRARSAVIRDSKTREIIHVSEPEMPIRFAKQLSHLMQAFTILGERDTDRLILRHIALSSLPKNRSKALLELVKSKPSVNNEKVNNLEALSVDTLDISSVNIPDEPEDNWKTADLAVVLNLPTTTTRRILEDLTALEILERQKDGSADTWEIRKEYRSVIKNYYVNYL